MSNESSESHFIGMLLSEPEKYFAELDSFPKRDWFQDKDLGKISEALQRSEDKDIKTISQATGIDIGKLITLQLDAPVSLNIKAFAHEIFDNYKGRDIQKKGARWQDAKKFDDVFFESVRQDMDEITETTNGIHELVFPQEALEKWIADKEDRISGKIKPIKINFPSLDNAFGGGLHPELITIAGRPGSGKSALLKSMFLRALKNNYRVAVFSIEMVINEYLDRLASEWVAIDGMRLKDPTCLDDDELDKVTQFAKEVFHKDFSFNSLQSSTADDVERLSKAAKIKMGGLDLIFVDHLHIMDSHNHKLDERQLLSDITRKLKKLSQVLMVPIVLAAQCNRLSEKRTDKRPLMSDLKGSGGIEENSNIIMFVHRPGMYDDDISKSNAEVYIAKNRHGPAHRTLNFRFNESLTAFEEIDL